MKGRQEELGTRSTVQQDQIAFGNVMSPLNLFWTQYCTCTFRMMDPILFEKVMCVLSMFAEIFSTVYIFKHKSNKDMNSWKILVKYTMQVCAQPNSNVDEVFSRTGHKLGTFKVFWQGISHLKVSPAKQHDTHLLMT